MTPIAITAIGWKFYIVFIVCNLGNAIFFWAFQPETKGLNLEDMVSSLPYALLRLSLTSAQDELFRESPTFVPGSKWVPTSHLEDDAREISKQEKEAGVAQYLEHGR